MDIWFPILSDRLESPQFEFVSNFIGGECVIQKDYLDEEQTSKHSGWLVHVYYKPKEFEDRPFIADVVFRCGKRRREMVAVLVKNNSFLGHLRTKEKEGRLIIAIRIRKMMCELDLSRPSGSRQFVVQNFESQIKEGVIFYVNVAKLTTVGGDLFKKWKAEEDLNLNTTTEHVDNMLIEILMEATAKYDDIVIIRSTVDLLIQISQRFRIHKLMRAIEDILSDTKLLNWDEKLLIALQYRMSVLYVQVQRKYLLSPWNILCRFQRHYISNFAHDESPESSNPYSKVHKHLLEMILLTEENICIG